MATSDQGSGDLKDPMKRSEQDQQLSDSTSTSSSSSFVIISDSDDNFYSNNFALEKSLDNENNCSEQPDRNDCDPSDQPSVSGKDCRSQSAGNTGQALNQESSVTTSRPTELLPTGTPPQQGSSTVSGNAGILVPGPSHQGSSKSSMSCNSFSLGSATRKPSSDISSSHGSGDLKDPMKRSEQDQQLSDSTSTSSSSKIVDIGDSGDNSFTNNLAPEKSLDNVNKPGSEQPDRNDCDPSDQPSVSGQTDTDFVSIPHNLVFLHQHKIQDHSSEKKRTLQLSDEDKIRLRLILSYSEMNDKLTKEVEKIGWKIDIVARDNEFCLMMTMNRPLQKSDYNGSVERCHQVISNTLRTLTVHKLEIEQDLKKFVDKASTKIPEIFEKEAWLFPSQKRCCVWVASSEEKIVSRIIQDLNKIKTSLIGKNIVSRLLSYKHIEFQVFKQEDIFSRLRQNYPDIKFKIQDELFQIKIEGHDGSVQGAVSMLDQLKSQVMEDQVKVSTQVMKLLQSGEVKKQVETSLKNKNICCVWSSERDKSMIAVHACQKKMLRDAVEHFKSFFVSETVIMDSVKILKICQSDEWNLALTQLHKRYRNEFILDICNETLTVTGMADAVNDCLEKWNELQKTFCCDTKTKTVVLEREALDYITHYQQGELREISEQRNVSLEQIEKSGKVGFLLKGEEQEVLMVEEYIKDLADGIASCRHCIDDEGDQEQVGFFRSAKGKALLEETESTCKCRIKLETPTATVAQIPQDMCASPGESIDGADPNFDGPVWTFDGDLDKCISVQMSEFRDVTADVVVRVVESRGDARHEVKGPWYESGGRQFAWLHCPVWKDGINKEKDQVFMACQRLLQVAHDTGVTSLVIPLCYIEKTSWKVMAFIKCMLVPIYNFFKDSYKMKIIFCDVSKKDLGHLVGTIGDSLKKDDDRVKIHYVKYRDRCEAPAEDEKVISISIVKGELAKQSADCLVNTTDRKLALDHGAVSKSLLLAAGKKIQEECSNGITFGDFAVSRGHKLNCHWVFHGALDIWSHYRKQELLKTMNRFIKSCLHEADRNKLKSVAFPALGSENLNYPITSVANEMFNAVEEYQKQNPQSTLTDVSFVVFPSNTEILKAFEKEKENRSSKKQGKAKYKVPGQTKRVDTSVTPDGRLEFSVGNIDVFVEKGDISLATDEGIVILWDESNKNREHMLLKKAGKDAIKDWTNNRILMSRYMSVCTVPGELPCSKIIHALVHQGSVKNAVHEALWKAKHFKSLTFSLSADDKFGADKWASSMFDGIKQFSKTAFTPSLRYIHLMIEDTSQLSIVISTLSQKAAIFPQQSTAIGGNETVTVSSPGAIGGNETVTVSSPAAIGGKVEEPTEKCRFRITGQAKAIQKAADHLKEGYRKARGKMIDHLPRSLSGDESFLNMPLKNQSMNLKKTGIETENTKKTLTRSISLDSSKKCSMPADFSTDKMKENDDIQNVSKKNNTAATNATPPVAEQYEPALQRSQQEECCVVLTDFEKMDKNKLTLKMNKHVRQGADVVNPFLTSGQILFVFPTPQDAESCATGFKDESCMVSKLDPEIVVNVKEEINPGLVKTAQARTDWQDLKDQIQSKSGVCIKESSDGATFSMEGSKLQIEEAESCLAEYITKCGVSHHRQNRARYHHQDLENDDDEICEITNFSYEMYQKFIDLFTDTLQNFKAHNVKLRHIKQDNVLLIIAPKSEIDIVETSIMSKLSDLSTMSTDEIFVTEKEIGKVDDVLNEIVAMPDGVHFTYDSSKRRFAIIGREWESIQSVKHKILIGIGRIKETGRRNRRFAESYDPSDFAETKPTNKVEFVRKSQFPPRGHKKYTTNKRLTVYVYCDNILELPVECIVNAANGNLAHGDGIAWVIAKAAGPKFEMESNDYVKQHGLLTVGTACTTGAGLLHYKCVVHTVGPRWVDYKYDDKENCLNDLFKACMACLLEAEKQKMKSIAIPAISAGVFGVPKDKCAEQYAKAVQIFSKTIDQDTHLREIHFMDKDMGIVWQMQTTFDELFKGGETDGGVSSSKTDMDDTSQMSKTKHGVMTCSQSARHADTVKTSNSHPLLDDFRRDDPEDNKLTDNQKQFLNLAASQPDFRYPEHKQKKTRNGKLCDVFRLRENFEVHVYSGDIVEFDGSAVVCSESTSKNKMGQVAKIISEKAGQSYRKEKKDKMQKSKRMIGDIVVTTAGYLKCSKVIHVIVPFWETSGTADFIAKISQCVGNVLDATSELSITTIAMPLLGAGRENSPVEKCANAFLYEVVAFSQKLQKLPHVKEIHIIDKHDIIPTVLAKNFKDYVQAEQDHLMSHWMKREMKKQGISERDNPSDVLKPKITALQSTSKNTGVGRAEDKKPEATKERQTCPICLDEMRNPQKLARCQHLFCEECIEQSFRVKPVCPSCGLVYGTVKGDQPEGKMCVSRLPTCLPGETCDTIVISYQFFDGTQGKNHPDPEKPYNGTTRIAYLPDSIEGRKVLELLKIAFQRKLIFTIGNSRTTGSCGVVTWNDIHHKTSLYGGSFGYPDPTYLSRVQEELAAKGITEKDLSISSQYV